jgi:tripartite ATP-independent transporter DctP family solute receptor
MMLKKSRCFVLAMVLVLVIVSCTTFAAAKKPIKLVFGTPWAPDDFLTKGDLHFKELVEKNSKGQILIDYFPASQLGTNMEMLQATRSGAQQLMVMSPSSMSQLWTKIGTLDLPYLYRDQKHHLKVADKLNSLIDQGEMASVTGLRALNMRLRSPRNLTTKFPVNKLADVKGLKIRVPEIQLYMSLWKALGAVPTIIPPADMYTALATGTVDAQENPLPTICSYKLYEVQKYCALTAHIRSVEMTTINANIWKKLTKTQQNIIQDAALKSAKKSNEDLLKSEEEAYNFLVDKGMKFTKPDLALFREKAKTLWGQFGDNGIIKKVEAIK